MKASYPTPLTTSNALELVVKQPSEAEPIENRDPEIFGQFPNSWGAFTVKYGFLSTANGSFAVESQVSTNVSASSSGGDKYEVANYSAQRGNAIYGSSSTVQPSSLYGLLLIRAY